MHGEEPAVEGRGVKLVVGGGGGAGFESYYTVLVLKDALQQTRLTLYMKMHSGVLPVNSFSL